MELKGRVALVTGSTSGIGLGIARALAAAGADVMTNGFGDPAAVVAELSAFGGRVLHDGADLTSGDAVRAMVAGAVARMGRVDILVNNAGIQHTAPIESFPAERWDQVIALNLSAVFHATAAAIPGMREAGWGRIINIASAHGLVASANKVAYVAAKHGVVGMTKVTAIELANTGITCNAICPGWVLTPLVEKQLHDRAAASGQDISVVTRELLAEKQPMHRFTTPEGIGAMAVFLCGAGANTITGVPLSIDGGWTAQ